MATMLETLESMKPAYAHALRMLEKSSGASSGLEQKVIKHNFIILISLYVKDLNSNE